MPEKPPVTSTRFVMLSVCALAFCAFIWPAMLTFDPGDWPSPNQYPHNAPAVNACGVVGAWFAYELHYYLGDGSYPLLVFLTLASVVWIARGRIGGVPEKIFGLFLLIASASAAAHLLSPVGSGPLPTGPGGVFGFALGELLRANLDRTGTAIVLVASVVVGLVFATEGWVLKVPAIVRRAGQPFRAALAFSPMSSGAVPENVVSEGAELRDWKAQRATQASRHTESFLDDPDQTGLAGVTASEKQSLWGSGTIDHGEGASSAGKIKTPTRRSDGQTAPEKVGPIIRFPSPHNAAAEPYPRQIENWRLPSLELLHEPEYGLGAQQEVVVRRQAQVLEQTLEEFRLDARVVQIDTGPVITMFELKLGAGIKVSQVATLSNDIARALKAHAIRVVAPISGKNTVGIEVPNAHKERVRLRELMSLAGRGASKLQLPLFLGKDASGAPLVTDLSDMPHLLIAGTTGSGKSVCLNAVTLSLLMTKRPDHVKLILIDPKMVEMSQFKEVPHLMCPIVTDMARAEKILEWAVVQMEERYELLAEAGVKHITGYNALGETGLYDRLKPQNEHEKSRIAKHLPYIVIVIDELADLMMTAAKEVEHHLSRLAQKSRAVGIHIIVATQRPEAKVVTGLIKSNLPSRICFRVASRMDSRIVLDQNGGEVLLGQGDMLFLPPGTHKLIRAQGTYLDDAEVRAVLVDLCARAQPEFHPELSRVRAGGADSDAALRDPLFDDAVRIILQSKRGSVSLLQRRLTIGYSRASRLIDLMAEAGIVGDYKGSQAREVLMTLDQWEHVRAQMAAEDGEE